jgi:hypothetical protein
LNSSKANFGTNTGPEENFEASDNPLAIEYVQGTYLALEADRERFKDELDEPISGHNRGPSLT